MTVDDALLAMARTDELHDGSAKRAAIVEALHNKLLQNPEDFWDKFFEALNSTHPDPTRELAERLLRSGAVHDLTTIADLIAILAEDAERGKQHQRRAVQCGPAVPIPTKDE